jgi:hypothetical protein
MPADSNRKKYTRRLKRQRNQAIRYAEQMSEQLDLFKQMLIEYRMKEIQAEQAAAQEAEPQLIVKPTLGQIAQADGLDFRGEK